MITKRFDSLQDANAFCQDHMDKYKELYIYYYSYAIRGGFWAASETLPEGNNISEIIRMK